MVTESTDLLDISGKIAEDIINNIYVFLRLTLI